jgi:hypothetical protein
MTVITGAAEGTNVDFDADDLSALDSSTLSSESATQFELSGSEFSLIAQGTGLTYSHGHPSGGTITSLTLQEAGATTLSGFSISVSALWSAISSGNVTTFNNLLFSGDDTFNMQATNGVDFLLRSTTPAISTVLRRSMAVPARIRSISTAITTAIRVLAI